MSLIDPADARTIEKSDIAAFFLDCLNDPEALTQLKQDLLTKANLKKGIVDNTSDAEVKTALKSAILQAADLQPLVAGLATDETVKLAYAGALGLASPALRNWDGRNVLKFRRALTGPRTGQGNGKLGFIGDSTMCAVGVDNVTNLRSYSVPTRCAKHMNLLGIPTREDNFMGTNFIPTANPPLLNGYYDARLTADNSWVLHTGLGVQTLGGPSLFTAGTTALRFAPTGTWDTIDIFSIKQNSYDYFDVLIDGVQVTNAASANGASVVNSSGNPAGFVKNTFTAPGGLGIHVVEIKRRGVAPNLSIAGARCYSVLPTEAKLEIFNLSASGGLASHFANASQPYAALNAIPLLGLDACLIQLGINDAIQVRDGALTGDQFKANMRAIITKLQGTGTDVIVNCCLPSATSQIPTAAQDTIYNATLDLLEEFPNVPSIDLRYRYRSQEEATAAGLFKDTLHMNLYGYDDEAFYLAQNLVRL